MRRVALGEAVAVVVAFVEADDERSLSAFGPMVLLRDSARGCGVDELFAIFLLAALRLGWGDCVSAVNCSSTNGGDVDALRRNIAGRSRFSPFTCLFSTIFVGPFCTCFRRLVGVTRAEADVSFRADRRPFTGGGGGGGGGDDRPFIRRGLDTPLDVDDFRDVDRDDDAVLSRPFVVSVSNGAIFFKCSMRCVGLLMRSTVRRFLVMTFVCLNSATRAFRVRCDVFGELSFTSS